MWPAEKARRLEGAPDPLLHAACTPVRDLAPQRPSSARGRAREYTPMPQQHRTAPDMWRAGAGVFQENRPRRREARPVARVAFAACSVHCSSDSSHPSCQSIPRRTQNSIPRSAIYRNTHACTRLASRTSHSQPWPSRSQPAAASILPVERAPERRRVSAIRDHVGARQDRVCDFRRPLEVRALDDLLQGREARAELASANARGEGRAGNGNSNTQPASARRRLAPGVAATRTFCAPFRRSQTRTTPSA